VTSRELAGFLAEGAKKVESLLASRLEQLGPKAPPRLLEAMRYSLLGGGKRLRPLLCLCFAEATAPGGGANPAAEDAACALEFIHTYSLIHDDLPAMDDDDLRRGRATNHKVFGEAMAILAGDALLTDAFTVLGSDGEGPRGKLCVELAQAAGAMGMVGGQVLDVAEDRPEEEAYLVRLHGMKTGALIRAACRMGVLAAGGSDEQLRAAGVYGEKVGLAFQIADDNLDVTADPQKMGKPTGADAKAGRFTFPALLGLSRSKELALELVAQAEAALKPFAPHAERLAALAHYSVEREA
jgi:geranylgeranyl diphosphate synthase type II